MCSRGQPPRLKEGHDAGSFDDGALAADSRPDGAQGAVFDQMADVGAVAIKPLGEIVGANFAARGKDALCNPGEGLGRGLVKVAPAFLGDTAGFVVVDAINEDPDLAPAIGTAAAFVTGDVEGPQK